MTEPPILLDSGPLGVLCHTSHGHPEVVEIRRWLRDLRRAGRIVCIPEIVDYEVRRELVLLGSRTGIENLNELGRRFRYLRLTTAILRRAAELWAQARLQGTPAASDAALDADVILAALAEREGGIVATDHVRHLSQFVQAMPWRDIRPCAPPVSWQFLPSCSALTPSFERCHRRTLSEAPGPSGRGPPTWPLSLIRPVTRQREGC